MTLSMRVRNSAYAFWHTTDIPTYYIYHAKSRLNTPVWGSLRSPNYIPPGSLYIFLWRVAWDISPYYTPYITRYTLSMRIVITTVIEMVEMVEILDGRLDNLSVERVRYVINNLLHLVIVKYGDISLVLCISTRLRLVTILSLLVKYLVILHADPCNKSYIYHAKSRLNTPVWGSLRSPNKVDYDNYWRASEASETLSGLFNWESRIYVICY